MAGFSTNSIHASNGDIRDVFPPISTSATYRYKEPSQLVKLADVTDYDYDSVTYSRENTPNTNRVEKTIASLTGGHVVVYNSGVSAIYAALVGFSPRLVAFNNGYNGSSRAIELYCRGGRSEKIALDDYERLGKGDLILLETPRNPDGTVFDISFYAEQAHARGALLAVDSTLAPPPLQDPFRHGADIVIHSATKYFGGHSDLLAGLVIVKTQELKDKLRDDRMYLGTNIGSLEASLLLRSLRTMGLRVAKHSENTEKLVEYLVRNKDRLSHLKSVHHSSLQKDDFVKKQLPKGHGGVFAIRVSSEEFARNMPSKLRYFIHATSLGSVESLIEWRVLSDASVPGDLLRISVGVEDVGDLIGDLEEALS